MAAYVDLKTSVVPAAATAPASPSPAGWFSFLSGGNSATPVQANSKLEISATVITADQRASAIENLRGFWEKWGTHKELSVANFVRQLNQLNYSCVDDAKKLKAVLEALQSPTLDEKADEKAIEAMKENVLKQIEKILRIPPNKTKVMLVTQDQWQSVREYLGIIKDHLSSKASPDIIRSALLLISHSCPKMWVFHFGLHLYFGSPIEDQRLALIQKVVELLKYSPPSLRKPDEKDASVVPNAKVEAARNDLHSGFLMVNSSSDASDPSITEVESEPENGCSPAVIAVALTLAAIALAIPLVPRYFPDLKIPFINKV